MPHILIVDDFKEGNLILSLLLERHGFETTTTNSAISAVNFVDISGDDIDVVITDLNMPKMDGFAFIEHLRQESKHPDKPILVLTASGREEDRTRAVELGATAYLTKPADRKTLISQLKVLLGKDADEIAS